MPNESRKFSGGFWNGIRRVFRITKHLLKQRASKTIPFPNEVASKNIKAIDCRLWRLFEVEPGYIWVPGYSRNEEVQRFRRLVVDVCVEVSEENLIATDFSTSPAEIKFEAPLFEIQIFSFQPSWRGIISPVPIILFAVTTLFNLFYFLGEYVLSFLDFLFYLVPDFLLDGLVVLLVLFGPFLVYRRWGKLRLFWFRRKWSLFRFLMNGEEIVFLVSPEREKEMYSFLTGHGLSLVDSDKTESGGLIN